MKSILVGLDGFLFLMDKAHMETAGKELSQHSRQRLATSFSRSARNGLHEIKSCSIHGLKDGRVVAWSADYMASMLDDEKLKYRRG